MKKSRATVQKDYRKRKGQDLKQKEKERSQKRRRNKTEEQKQLEREQRRKRDRRHYARKKEDTDQKTTAQSGDASLDRKSAFKFKSTFQRSKERVRKVLPRSPNKKLAIIGSLANEFGIPTPKSTTQTCRPGARISLDIQNKVCDFYQREDIARWTPGRKEYIREPKTKQKIQKRYLVATLKELYRLFKEESGMEKEISFSKFCEFRPVHVITYTKTPAEACCCMHHQNFVR